MYAAAELQWRDVSSHLIVFQSCKFEGSVSPKKASIEGEMKNLEESRRLAK